MTAHDDTSAPFTTSPNNAAWLSKLPPGTELRRVAYVAQPAANQQVLVSLPQPLGQVVVLSAVGNDTAALASNEIDILTIPATDSANDHSALAGAAAWIDSAVAHGDQPCMVMNLQATQVLWRPGRFAVISTAERSDAVCEALVLTAFLDTELTAIERALATAWPQLEADLPHAFEFASASLTHRRRLRQRFQESLLLRARLARLAPQVHAPHLHPPTLASQVAERFRDRTRVTHRHESLDEQLQVFERVYESCGQRASDFMLTRSGNTLEWIIILLLAGQTLLLVFDILSNTGQ
jgi:hypothetical protein